MSLEINNTTLLIGAALIGYVLLSGGNKVLGGVGEAVEGTGTLIKDSTGAISKVIKGRPDEGTLLVGQKCSDHYQCSSNPTSPTPGYGSTFTSQIGCCNGVCSMKRKDWLGIYWCPNDAPNLSMTEEEKKVLESNAEKIKKNDTLLSEELKKKASRKYDTKGIGEYCSSNYDCSNNGIAYEGKPSTGIGEMVRCNPRTSRCSFLKKDWLGSWWLPDECVGKLFDKPGSCSEISQVERDYNDRKK